MPAIDDDTVSLEDQRSFGTGMIRRPITFVPAARSIAHSDEDTTTDHLPSAADRYLTIVLDKACSAGEVPLPSTLHRASSIEVLTKSEAATHPTISCCEICRLPLVCEQSSQVASKSPTIEGQHESSLAHQVCLKHSYPPSHLDRTRHGLRYLSCYGWDPDSRLGLGADGKGIRDPVKATLKQDTVGLGLTQHRQSRTGKMKERGGQRSGARDKPLDAGQIRRRTAEARAKETRLKDMLFGREEVVRYLYGDVA